MLMEQRVYREIFGVIDISNEGIHKGAAVAPPVQALLAAAGGFVRDAQARERFGDLGPAFAATFGSWLEPFAAAIHGLEPTPHSQAAARALADTARLVGTFAHEAARSDAARCGAAPPPVGATLGRAGTGPPDRPVHGGAAGEDVTAGSQDVKAAGEDVEAGRQGAEGGTGSYDRYVRLAAQVDDSFRAFSSSPEFDHARRRAATALLDWLEHDRAAASSIARAFEAGAAYPERQHDGVASPVAGPAPTGIGPAPAGAEVIMRDGSATLLRYPARRVARASVLMVPGFTTGARLFDFDPRCSFAGVLADHGVETCLLDWGRPDEADRRRTVADQIRRIDRALDTARAAADGAATARRPVAIAGHFHGGLLALLHCIRYPGKAGALVTLSTPARFAPGQDPFGEWLRACGGERLAEVFGNVPGALVAALLAAASPMQWCGGGGFSLLGGAHRADAAARIELARRFPPAFPGKTFRQLYRAFHRADPFAEGGSAVIDDHEYDPANLTTPLLNVFAREDRIVPAGASSRLEALVGAKNRSRREHPGGHFDLLTGHRAHTEFLPDVAAWLIGHAPES